MCRAVKHVLSAVGFEGIRATDKSGDHSIVTMEMEPEDVQWLKVCAFVIIVSLRLFKYVYLFDSEG